MSATKAALKAINAAVQSQKYDEAIQQARNLLNSDPQSYQAKQSKYPEAEEAFDAAARIKEGEPHAWQGLIQLYEKQGGAKVGQYQIAALRLAQIYQAQDDKYKCQDVIDKFLDFAKIQGTPLEYRKSREVILPDSPIYEYLEGRKNSALIRKSERGERGWVAKISQVTIEVKREVLKNSNLEELYNKIIDWTTEDEIRRKYEEKLIERLKKRSQLFKLANDMVIIKHKYKLAWDIAIEWLDPENIQSLDVNVLREYVAFFPTSGLAQVLRGFMSSEISPFPPPPRTPDLSANKESHDESSSDEDDDDGGVKLDDFSMPAERSSVDHDRRDDRLTCINIGAPTHGRVLSISG
ncbi:hypothetical protein EYC84_009138 [Monilinia fructicola]|uniref:Uncharacterized protein n=1 Tax=Monilinia fructicola TaxID=38448 RepID=A0A5M9JFJ5_MONFR|nr:hypothetical protein EYC84_009138 [Monilinia fructicola]